MTAPSLSLLLCCSLFGLFVNAFGTFSVGEIGLAAVGIVGYSKYGGISIESDDDKLLVICLLLLALLQAVSDGINGTVLLDAAKGIGAYILLFFGTVALLNFSGRYESSLRDVTVASISLAVGYVLTRIESGGSYWKSGFLLIAAFACYLMLVAFRRKYSTYAFARNADFSVALGGAILGAANDFRSGSAVLLLGYLVAKTASMSRTIRGFMLLASSLPALAIALLVLLILIFASYVGAAGMVSTAGIMLDIGLIDGEQFQKYISQAAGDFGILIGGRSDIVGGTIALMDQPIVGHGSWAKDTRGYAAEMDLFMFEHGYAVNPEAAWMPELIPSHSHIVQAGVWSGVGAIVVWLLMLGACTRMLLRQVSVLVGTELVLIMTVLIYMWWQALFSPFGFLSRMQMLLMLAIIIVFTRRKKQQS